MGKVCSKCNTWKPLEQFYFKERGYLGRNARCIACVKGRVHAYQDRTRKERREHQLRNLPALLPGIPRKPWSVEEDDALIRHYGVDWGLKEAAGHLTRSWDSIRFRVVMLGIRADRKDWRSDPESSLGFTPREKEVPQTREWHRWQEWEHEWLIEHYGVSTSIKQCADYLGLSHDAVCKKIQSMGLRRDERDWRQQGGTLMQGKGTVLTHRVEAAA